MAHEKVVRRSMSAEEWIALRIAWLAHRLVAQSIPVENWRVREAYQTGAKEYEYYDAKFRPLKIGDIFYTPGGTAFLKTRFIMPRALAGRKVWLQLATASEMMVKINGLWRGALDPNRERILVAEKAKPNAAYTIEIEGYNRSKPDDERDLAVSHLRGCRQAFPGAALVVINEEVKDLYYDCAILNETMLTEYVQESIREYLKRELDRALSLVDHETDDNARWRAGVRKAKKYLAATVFKSRPAKNFCASGKVALVAHSHLDIAYFWRTIHAAQKNARTCLIQLDLMKRYPEFFYAHTQAYTYEILERHYPDIFAEVKRLVRAKRFELAGAMYVEPDCNLPGAESLVRQCFYGQHFFRSRFGVTVENCWLPDVFGNSWILPQILRQSGVKYFVSNKMSTWNDTNRFPHNHFIWRGIDGSEVFACVPPTHFITWNTPKQIAENWERFQEKETSGETLSMFGYGDGGSGVTEQMLEYNRRLNRTPGLPLTRHVRADTFLADIFKDTANLDTWDGELYLEMHRGTFTTNAVLKQLNRRLEILARDAEMIATLAALEGFSYPQERINAAWKKILVNQFHDILPGTHIAPVTRDAIADYHDAARELETILNNASARFFRATPSGGRIALLNTLSWQRSSPAFIEGDFDNVVFEDLLAQRASQHGKKGVWTLPRVDGCATRTYALRRRAPANKTHKTWCRAKGRSVHTPFYDVVFNKDGSITRLFDRPNRREIVAGGESINQLKIYRDTPGIYDAWDILPNYRDSEETVTTHSALCKKEEGDVFVSFSVTKKTRRSTWKQTIRLYREHARIDFENEVDWHEKNRLAKAEFHLAIHARHVSCDTSAGTIVRETHQNTSWQKAQFEVCHHKWADISEPGYGVAILNDGKYGISFNHNSIGLSLLRASIRPDPNADEGLHRFTYALLPHKGTAEDAGVARAGWEFNSPLRSFYTHNTTAGVKSFLRLTPPNLHLQALKMPHDGDRRSCIVRVVEIEGKRGIAELKLPAPVIDVKETNLLEDVMPGRRCVLKNGSVFFEYLPYQLFTFRLKMAAGSTDS